MKVAQKTEGFAPIILSITIESILELKLLWAQLNACNKDVVRNGRNVNLPDGAHLENYQLFEVVDNLVIKNKCKRNN